MNQSSEKHIHNIFSRITNTEFIPVYVFAVLLFFLYLIHPDLRYSKYVYEPTWFYPVVCTGFLVGVFVPVAYLIPLAQSGENAAIQTNFLMPSWKIWFLSMVP